MTNSHYAYDIFVSYSLADKAWTRGWLLPRLEAAGVRVCIDFRDFAVGAPVLENRVNAVEQSRHTLLILTPDWVASELAAFESLLAQTADPAAQQRRVLPVMLEPCQPSSRLAILDYADFTQPDQWDAQLARIVEVVNNKITPRQAVMVAGVRASARAPFVLPQLDISSFTGRSDELHMLEELLIRRDGPKLCSIVGLAGTGGVGKSALACHFAQLHREHFPAGVVGLRVDGKDVDTLAREFARYYETIDPDDQRDAATIMQEAFGERRALLIFDNADDAAIRALRPGGDICAVIVTTRDRELPFLLDIPPEGHVDLTPLSHQDAWRLLEQLLGASRLAAEPEAARHILELVGNLPLAIQIVGATLRLQPAFSLAQYAASLSLAKLRVRRDAHLDVRASFALSLELLEPAEIDFFACLSVCAKDGFAVRTAMAAADCDEPTTHERLGYLYRMSLLNHTDAGPHRFVFHPLIRMFAEELAGERNLCDGAAERHARHFTMLVKSSDIADEAIANAVAEDLDDIVLAAEWLQKQQIADYEFIIRLEPFFQHYGHWLEAAALMAGFLKLAERISDWPAIAQLRIQQAKYHSLRGDWQSALAVLEPLPDIVQKIEPQSLYQRCEAMWLNTLGGIMQRQGRFDEAVDLLQRSAQVEEQLGNRRGQAKVLNSLGSVLQRQGHLDKAIEVFQRSAQIEGQIGNRRGQAMMLNSLGGVLQRQGRFDEAVDTFERSYRLEVELDDQRGQAMVLNSLGGVLQRQGRFDEAVDVFQQSAIIEKQIGNQRGQAMVLNSLGGVLQRQGRFDEAVDAFERSYRLLVELDDRRGQAMALNSLGGVLQRQGRFDEAVDAFERSYTISEQLGDQRSLAMVLNSLGGVLQRQGRFDEAIDAFERSCAIAKKSGDNLSLAMRLNSLGGVLQRQGRFDEAVGAFEHSYRLEVELDDRRGQAMVLNSLGGVLQRQGRFDEAVEAFEHSYAISEQLGDQRSLAMVLNSLGGVLQRQGRFDEAVDAFKRGLAIVEELDNQVTIAMILNSLGGVLQRQGYFDKAIDAFERSYRLLAQLDDRRGQAMVLNSLGGVLQRQGRFDQAVEAFQRSIAIGEELKDWRHLAMVHTSLGKALLSHGDAELAAAELRKGFEIDERLRNNRGVGIVAPMLIRALIKLDRYAEAQAICRRALAIAPGNKDLIELRSTLANPQGVTDQLEVRQGRIKRLLPNSQGYHYGFIEPDDQSQDIYFHKSDVLPTSLSKLLAGARVELALERQPDGRLRGRNVRVLD